MKKLGVQPTQIDCCLPERPVCLHKYGLHLPYTQYMYKYPIHSMWFLLNNRRNTSRFFVQQIRSRNQMLCRYAHMVNAKHTSMSVKCSLLFTNISIFEERKIKTRTKSQQTSLGAFEIFLFFHYQV